MLKLASALLVSGLVLILSLPLSFAHAVLVKSTPDAGGVLPQDSLELHLTFTEALEPRFSTFKLEAVDDGEKAPVSVSFEERDKSVVLKLANKLRPGSYKVHWNVVSTDTHRSEGELAFSVK